MNPIVADFQKQAQQTIHQLKEDLKSIRTGRANPSLLENIIVETYGGQTKLKLLEIASIVNEEPTLLTINAYDPSTVEDIEKAIRKSPMGLNPQTQGTRILVRLPPLNEEQRSKLVKVINEMVEEKRQIIRTHRDDARRKIKAQFEAKTLGEDQKFRMEKELDTASTGAMDSIQAIRESKDREIMEV